MTSAAYVRTLLESPRSHAVLAIVVPILVGLASLAIGQDSNFDLLNYHLHNAWALLNDRIVVDLAPAHLQSYFNPLLDIPYYVGMIEHRSPRITAFAMGLVHGACFTILLFISKHFVSESRAPRTNAIVLAAAGCTSAVFLSELGNTMGDNTTAPLVLGSLAVLLKGWNGQGITQRRELWIMLGAGFLAGAAAGLKLTNSVYALAACASLFLAWPAVPPSRFKAASAFAFGVVLGISVTLGFWMLTLWQEFGNPLFPLFNRIFHAPLAAEISIADTRWLPRSLTEAITFPYLMSLDPGRVGENGMRQITLAVMYTLFIAVGAKRVLRSIRPGRVPVQANSAGRSKDRFLLLFIAISFLVWLALFSIHRYLAVVELVAPIGIWLLLHELPINAVKATYRFLAASAFVAIVSWSHWGSVGFTKEIANVPTPPIASPTESVVVISGSPLTWMLPFFPEGPAYISLDHSFPESQKYAEQARRRIASAQGHAYLMLEASSIHTLQNIERIDRILEKWSTPSDGVICGALRWMAGKSRRYRVEVTPDDHPERCEVRPAASMIQAVSRKNDELLQAKQVRLEQAYGIRFEPAECRIQASYWGALELPYNFCRIDQLVDR